MTYRFAEEALAEYVAASDGDTITVLTADQFSSSRSENPERAGAKQQNRERAFINAAKTEAMNQTVRRNGNGVRM